MSNREAQKIQIKRLSHRKLLALTSIWLWASSLSASQSLHEKFIQCNMISFDNGESIPIPTHHWSSNRCVQTNVTFPILSNFLLIWYTSNLFNYHPTTLLQSSSIQNCWLRQSWIPKNGKHFIRLVFASARHLLDSSHLSNYNYDSSDLLISRHSISVRATWSTMFAKKF